MAASEAITVLGWQTPPFYNPATHNLEWAIRLRGGDGSSVVNYKTKLLGRRGVMDAMHVRGHNNSSQQTVVRCGNSYVAVIEHRGRIQQHLEDENGDKGGLDKLCTVIVDVPGSGRVVVRERRESFLAAATRAAHRIALAVRSRLHRRRGIRRGRPMEAYLEVVLPG